MLTDKEKAIALECFNSLIQSEMDMVFETDVYKFSNLFLSRIREEQFNQFNRDDAITLLKKWREEGTPEEDAAKIQEMLDLRNSPPAAPDCSELVDMLNRAYWELDCFLTKDMGIMVDIREALANHAKRKNGEE